MLNNRKIKVLHLEPTDVCQAACPLCARETDPLFNKSQQHHLNMDQILNVFDLGKISDLDKMFMCGNYGDPAAGKYTLDIFQKFRQINPSIVLGMNSNGALQNSQWWIDLASVLNQHRDYVVFSIDGLQDTNHIYRKNVDWHKLINNVKAFTSAGGVAHWDMLIYQHNEHQIQECQQLAKDLGFKWFRGKVSKRPLRDQLQFPVNWVNTKINTRNIRCHAINENSVFVDAKGRLSPCCWLGADYDQIPANWDTISNSWHNDNPNKTCVNACSHYDSLTPFLQQWKFEIEL